MLAVSVAVEALDLFDDAETTRKKGKKGKKHDFIQEVPILVPVSLPNPTILNQLV
jgi:hypothetical protein